MSDDPYYLEFEGKLKPGWKERGYYDEDQVAARKKLKKSTYQKIYNDEPALTHE